MRLSIILLAHAFMTTQCLRAILGNTLAIDTPNRLLDVANKEGLTIRDLCSFRPTTIQAPWVSIETPITMT